MKKRAVIALGHRALGTTLSEQKVAIKETAKSIADLIEEGRVFDSYTFIKLHTKSLEAA
jgi:carbamate kinase